jgi:ElaB/YqjD/DUF883 family membrane-anchored ribosome-binding protein
MADLQELQQQLNNIEEVLGLLVHVSDEKIPQLKNDINDIVKNIKGGFDKEELAKQIRTVLNQVINQSDYSKLQANIDTTTKKMIDAVETSSRQVDQWRDDYHSRSMWYFVLVSLVVGVGIGIGGSYYVTMKKFTQYQDVVDATSFYARYINSSCKIKTDFAKFIGQSQKYDCNTSWISGSDYLAKKE